MNALFVAFPFIVWVVSQTMKFGIRVVQDDVPFHLKDMGWVYVWAGGAPSTHTAILISSLCLIWYYFRSSPVSTFCTGVTMLWLYDMVSDRKRQEMVQEYLAHDASPAFRKMAEDGYVLDLAGHTWTEIAWGAALGIVLAAMAIRLWKRSVPSAKKTAP